MWSCYPPCMHHTAALHATQMIHCSYLFWVHVKLLFATLDSLVLHNIFTRGEWKKITLLWQKWNTISVPQNIWWQESVDSAISWCECIVVDAYNLSNIFCGLACPHIELATSKALLVKLIPRNRKQIPTLIDGVSWCAINWTCKC